MPADPGTTARKAAVLGKPIAHSRSPLLHLAAYRALGLTDWTYERIECDEAALPGLVAGLSHEWVGLSVTMPGKFAALRTADVRADRAELLGSANTLVATADGWLADNTDVDGVAGALGTVLADGERIERAVVLGAGGTAPAAVAGLAALGATEVTVVSRSRDRAENTLGVAEASGLVAHWCAWDAENAGAVRDLAATAHALVSTVPAEVAADLAGALAGVPVLLDAIYHPWPTPLAATVTAAGGRVVGGLTMLLHQAFTQVELFTGRPAPRAEMAAALACA